MSDGAQPDSQSQAGFAWARFRRLMAFMVVLSLAVVGIALWQFYREFGLISIHFYIAAGLGVFFAMMLTGGLMGLVFASNASGHDAAQDHSGAGDPGSGDRR